MHVSAILGNKGNAIFSVEPGDNVSVAIDILSDKRIGAVLVVADGDLCGVFSERDIVRTLKSVGAGALGRPVKEFMTKELFTCGMEDTIDHLMGLMTEKRVRHVPVIDNGKLAGMITIGDVVKFRISEVVAETDALKSYIASG